MSKHSTRNASRKAKRARKHVGSKTRKARKAAAVASLQSEAAAEQ